MYCLSIVGLYFENYLVYVVMTASTTFYSLDVIKSIPNLIETSINYIKDKISDFIKFISDFFDKKDEEEYNTSQEDTETNEGTQNKDPEMKSETEQSASGEIEPDNFISLIVIIIGIGIGGCFLQCSFDDVVPSFNVLYQPIREIDITEYILANPINEMPISITHIPSPIEKILDDKFINVPVQKS